MYKSVLFSIMMLVSAAAAQAQPGACVLYVANDGAPVSVQASCDGADLKEIFQASGISAAVSKGIPHFLAKGYSFRGCTDSHSDGDRGVAYSRCFFVKE